MSDDPLIIVEMLKYLMSDDADQLLSFMDEYHLDVNRLYAGYRPVRWPETKIYVSDVMGGEDCYPILTLAILNGKRKIFDALIERRDALGLDINRKSWAGVEPIDYARTDSGGVFYNALVQAGASPARPVPLIQRDEVLAEECTVA